MSTKPDVVILAVAPQLQCLMYSKHRRPRVECRLDGVSTIGHLLGSVEIPPTEVGDLLVGGSPVAVSWLPRPGAVVDVTPRRRPQSGSSFALDVHLGTLARRMRLLGVDTVWRNDFADDELIDLAARESRVILTRDRGLLMRRAVSAGAYVRGNDPDEQLADVLDRFGLPLAPWTRCLNCNGFLEPVEKSTVIERLEPGTRRSYDEFARCTACGQVYWRGAHAGRLDQIVERFS
jgi:uncharacterized protein with PIN domain